MIILSKADEMFKKLGYRKRSNKNTGYFEYIKEEEGEKGKTLCISFDVKTKTFMCALYERGIFFTSRALAIFPEEFKAIQEQMKELRWLDE